MFSGWYTLRERCSVCDLAFEPTPGDTWGMTYIGTAFFTGIFILVVAIIRPPRSLLDKIIYIGVTLAFMIGTMPQRKGLAVAILYLVRRPSVQEDGAKEISEKESPQ